MTSRFRFLAAFAALACVPTLSHAAPMPFEEMMCPLDTIGEAELNSWQPLLIESGGILSEAQFDRIHFATGKCAVKHGWSEADTASVFEANAGLVTSTAMADILAEAGVDLVPFDVEINNLSLSELRAISEDPDNDPNMLRMLDMLRGDMGSAMTDEIGYHLVNFITVSAMVQVATINLTSQPPNPS